MAEHFSHLVRGSGPGLLLAHGAGGCVEANFGPILDDLSRTHTVVGADYPGSGATPRSRGPMILDDLADDLVAAALDAGVERFAVLGYSLGTAVAARIATRHAQRVTGLILTSGFALPDNRFRLVLEVWRELLGADRTLLAKFLTLIATGDPHLNSMSPDEIESSIGQLADRIPAGSPDQVDLALTVDTRTELSEVAAPALVVATTFDSLVPPSLSRELARTLPRAELVEIAAGHNIAAEAADEWLAAIQRFLSGVA